MTTVVTIGEAMGLAVNDRPGTLPASRNHTVSFGGAESNVAVVLRRLGVDATWVSRVGADPFGELITRELTAEGVHVQVRIDSERPTGFMHKLRRTSHAGTVTFWRAGSAASGLSVDDVPNELIASADVLHLTGILPGISESARACALRAAHVARETGTLVSFDLNHRESVWKQRDAASTYRELIELSDIVFAGAEEAALVAAGETPGELAAELHRLGPSEVVIKLGDQGAMSLVDSDQYVQPAYPVDVVDSVGAGDAFVGGYLSALLSGFDPQRRLARGALAGALACTVLGDWEGAPTLTDLTDLTAAEGIRR